jgi:hypothetical protein
VGCGRADVSVLLYAWQVQMYGSEPTNEKELLSLPLRDIYRDTSRTDTGGLLLLD